MSHQGSYPWLSGLDSRPRHQAILPPVAPGGPSLVGKSGSIAPHRASRRQSVKGLDSAPRASAETQHGEVGPRSSSGNPGANPG